jgi:hypothetical protein
MLQTRRRRRDVREYHGGRVGNELVADRADADEGREPGRAKSSGCLDLRRNAERVSKLRVEKPKGNLARLASEPGWGWQDFHGDYLCGRLINGVTMDKSTRRGFLATAGALAGTALLPHMAEAEQAPQGWDLSFVDRFTGKHKQVFDIMEPGLGLVVIKNWLNAWESVYGLKHPDVNAIAGIAGKGFVINANDEAYAKFPIGELFQVTDAATGKPALKNPFMDGGQGMMAGAGVRPLQARGVTFWMCNNALNAVAGRIATAVKRQQPEVYTELRAMLNPGVILVPAHTMLVGIVQEKGFTYEVV